MEKIWHKKKNTRILLIIIANVMAISMMLGVMSIMSYAELFDDLITGKLTQSYEDSYDFDTELMNSAYQVMSGIDSEQMFETDGKIKTVERIAPIDDQNATSSMRDVTAATLQKYGEAILMVSGAAMMHMHRAYIRRCVKQIPISQWYL